MTELEKLSLGIATKQKYISGRSGKKPPAGSVREGGRM